MLEKAAVTDASGNPVDLSELFKAEDGDEAARSRATAEEGAAAEQAASGPSGAAAPVASDPTALPTIAVADFEPDDAKA